MFLVAGLAVAGLAGIAAAFYFSMRPRAARTRSARSAGSAGSGRAAGPARDSRVPAGRRRTAPPSSSRAAHHTGASTVIDFTGPQQILDDDSAPRRRLPEADTEETEKAAARSHRRVGWRKGSDVDEELWPAEQFGGVSDEQFWDDLAADKPLATTARAAQPETATRRRPPNAGPLPDLYPAGGRSAPEGPGTQPQPRLDPDDRTAIQPAVPSFGTAPAVTQSYSAATQPYAAAPQAGAVAAAQPYTAATQPAPAVTRPSRGAGQPAAPRGRSRSAISPDEDPLTSPAYALRAQGSVDGRSGQPSTGGWYPDAAPASRQFDRPAHGANGRGRPDPLRSDAYRPDAYRSESLRSDPLRSDPLRSDAYRSDPLRSDPLRSDPLRSDAYRSDPLRSDPLRSEHRRPDPLRADRYRPDPLRPNNGQAAATHPYPQQSYGEPGRPGEHPALRRAVQLSGRSGQSGCRPQTSERHRPERDG